MQLNTGDMSV